MESRSSKSMMLWVLLLVLLILTSFIYFKPTAHSENKRTAPKVPVKAVQLTSSSYTDSIFALGNGEAKESIEVTAATSDYVSAIHFDDNKAVKQGDLLLTLEDEEEQAKLKELKATLFEQKRQLARLLDLAKEKATSQSLVDEQRAKVQVSLAQIEVAKTQLKQLSIRAPFSGVLGLRQVSLGSYLTPGTIVTTLDDITVIKVAFEVPEKHLSDLKISQKVSVTTDAYPAQEFTGKLTSIDYRVNPITRSIQLRAEIDNTDYKLRPGMLLNIEITKSVSNALLLPESAVIPQQDKQFVFRIKADSTVEKISVTTGRRQPGVVEIIAGLNEGDRIVTEGTLRLTQGSTVNVQED